MIAALQYTFMQHALIAGVLVSIACGVIGAFVVVKRIVFISGGIAHTAYGGIGLGYYFRYMILPGLVGAGTVLDPRPGVWPLLGAIVVSLAAAVAMGVIRQRTEQRADTLIGVLWALGMAMGIILVDLTAGYKVDLMSYLFGSILAVERRELWAMVILNVVIIAVVALLYKELLAVSFDETFATVTNVPVGAITIVLLSLVALTVVMLMRVVGLIMVIAMLTMPAAIAGHHVRSLTKMMGWAVGLGVVFTTVGLALSYAWNLTSGASIIIVSGLGYLTSLAIRGARSASAQLS
jgi:zinc transport system permease protein